MTKRDRLIKILKELGVDDWMIKEESLSSREYFFIRKDLDMNRAKDIRRFDITLFRLFEEKGQVYRGSAGITLPGDVSDEEAVQRLEKAWFAASFVKNPPYPMAEPEESQLPPVESPLTEGELSRFAGEIYEKLYSNDTRTEGGVNSSEIFLNRREYRLITSRGIDIEEKLGSGVIELICDWKGKKADVEIYNMFSFSDPHTDTIEEESREQLENCRLRSQAVKAPELMDIPIILTGEAVREIADFYRQQSGAKQVYEKTARGVVGEVFQGNDVKGDRITISLDPVLPGSSGSRRYDDDGTALRKQEIYKEGKLLRYHGNIQYSHYLGVPPTGMIKNLVLEPGSASVEEWRRSPHVEIRSFSAFQMDGMTGDFGGEIRLALWHDGKKTVPLTGASLSACLFDVQKEFYLSRETTRREHYDGPAYLMFPKGHLAG
jgi:predicted Zn-dependent protease